MIQITPQMRIWVAIEAIDFRKGIDGIAHLCKQELQQDPFSGNLFVFRNRSATTIKILVYDGQGFWLCQKRLSARRFRWWPSATKSSLTQLEAHELTVMLASGNPEEIGVPEPWRRVAVV